MRIRVADRQRRLRVAKSALRTIARVALAAHEPSKRYGGRERYGGPQRYGGRERYGGPEGYDEVGITLLDDAEMRSLNRAFRGLGRTTDVLAFDLRRSRSPGEPRSGEVVISTDRVLAQAPRYRVTPARELARLAVHGLLHLRGFDHHRLNERRRMRATERRLLTALAPAIDRLVLASPLR